MLAFDPLAGVKEVLLFITEDSPVALETLTAVGECIDGQAGAVHTSTARRNMGIQTHQAERIRMEKGSWEDYEGDVLMCRLPPLLPLPLLPSLPGFCFEDWGMCV